MIGLVIVKCAGAALLVAAAYLLGAERKRRLTERVAVLESLQEALRYLDNKLSVSGFLLADGLRACGRQFYEEQMGEDLFSLAANGLTTSGAGEAWLAAVESFRGQEVLKAEDKQALQELATALGNADGEHQSAHIGVVVNRLQELEKKAEAAKVRDGGLVVKLALAGAAVVILLLW